MRDQENAPLLLQNKLNRPPLPVVMVHRPWLTKWLKQRQNWLPAPRDGFRFTARFYGAATPLIDASYNMPGVVRVA